MPNSNSKGDKRERELVNLLDSEGWAVMRAPSSGSATERDLPDLLAGNRERFYAIEVKAASRENPIYVGEEEIESLRYFADAFGAKARLGIRFDYTDWAFLHPEDTHRTPSGKNYRVKHCDVATQDPIELLPDVVTINDL